MAKSPEVHTVPNPNGGWDNKQDGESIGHYDTKEAAVESGRKIAMRDETEHRIHNKDGQIGESNSYGHDPYPPKLMCGTKPALHLQDELFAPNAYQDEGFCAIPYRP